MDLNILNGDEYRKLMGKLGQSVVAAAVMLGAHKSLNREKVRIQEGEALLTVFIQKFLGKTISDRDELIRALNEDERLMEAIKKASDFMEVIEFFKNGRKTSRPAGW